jgi:hypothetical protein
VDAPDTSTSAGPSPDTSYAIVVPSWDWTVFIVDLLLAGAAILLRLPIRRSHRRVDQRHPDLDT